MNITTFNELAEKKINGTFALLTGKVKVDGSIFTLKKYENQIVFKYFPNNYSKN